ncbi:anthranilate phosphoribosyltransferase [Thalassotalea aquiviva]|uniref:anthranilate phosphoribosyltransferase n=1 Tax=Thalassotalea aquiviva TaxID=3242415 RepID=UPI00352BCC05
MNNLLQQLIDQHDLSMPQAQEFFADVVNGNVAPERLAAVLTALKMKGESPDEIAGAAVAIRQAATAFPRMPYPLVDCVGTGGDGANTINISTTAAIVAACCGLKVAKHGNRSVSSKSGSADLLEAFEVNLNMTPEVAAKCIDQTNLCFLFAPKYHTGFKHAGPVRQAMGVRTIFNILGPLVNPASPKVMLLGVYSEALLEPMAKALVLTGVERAWVVHGSGLDELAIHGDSTVLEIQDGKIKPLKINPEDFGLKRHPIKDIEGGTPEQNAEFTRAILTGKGQQAHRDAVILNAAALLYLAEKATSYLNASEQVKQVLASGLAAQTIQKMAQISHG